METFLEYVNTQCPPGMDEWVASNKQAFMDTHGDEYQVFLMSAAWSLYKKIYRNDDVFSQ